MSLIFVEVCCTNCFPQRTIHGTFKVTSIQQRVYKKRIWKGGNKFDVVWGQGEVRWANCVYFKQEIGDSTILGKNRQRNKEQNETSQCNLQAEQKLQMLKQTERKSVLLFVRWFQCYLLFFLMDFFCRGFGIGNIFSTENLELCILQAVLLEIR